ncbi:tRNA lysidine(34) synthetase TilS [Ornithinibacillus bavariensis]|uniref:tRNA lysidine(34) synthetase TilS n=1 Tax=Ornithinibacillus bavariensis TaxID=545502 RepID=UPI003D23A4E9
MKEEVLSFMAKHQLIMPHATILIAVSGGPDSMALLHFLKTIQQAYDLRLVALSVDHQLRGEESKQDLAYVEEKCREWEIEFVGTSVNVKEYKHKEHIGTQLAARKLRYQFFEEQMSRLKADYLAFGHHGDDQVETMLMRLVRTAESSSFSGIPVKRNFAGGYIIRPFLCVTKIQLEKYCQENGIIPRIDPSNEGTDYTRNFFRKNVIPLLKNKNESVHRTIQNLSETLQADEDFLQMEAQMLVEEVVQFEENPKKVMLSIEDFSARASALQRRAFHLILNYLYDDLPKDLSYVHEDHFFSLIRNDKSNAQIDFPRHLKVEKTYNKLIFSFRQDEIASEFESVITIPGETQLPNGAKIIASFKSEIPFQDENTYVCLKDKVELPLQVRTRRDGDRMSWKGLNGSKKIKDIFIDEKIPLYERNRWPIITDNKGEIVWLVGLKKKDATAIPNKDRSLYIHLKYEQGKF